VTSTRAFTGRDLLKNCGGPAGTRSVFVARFKLKIHPRFVASSRIINIVDRAAFGTSVLPELAETEGLCPQRLEPSKTRTLSTISLVYSASQIYFDDNYHLFFIIDS